MLTRSSRRARVALFATASMVGGALLLAGPASATPAVKVRICHATNSQSHPYVIATVDASSIDEQNNKFLNGHGDHTGPAFYPGIEEHWGDIIPSFSYTNPRTGVTTQYPGSDSFLTTTGAATWGNRCVPVAPVDPEDPPLPT